MNITLNIRNYKKLIFLFLTIINFYPCSLVFATENNKNTKREGKSKNIKWNKIDNKVNKNNFKKVEFSPSVNSNDRFIRSSKREEKSEKIRWNKIDNRDNGNNFKRVVFFIDVDQKDSLIQNSKTRKKGEKISWNSIDDVATKNTFKKVEFSIDIDPKNSFIQNTKAYDKLVLAKRKFNKGEIEIQSEIQSEKNNILKAEGEVLVFYKNFILNGDSLIYDKRKKILNAKGNLSLIVGKQIFKMKSFEYDFDNEKGFLLDVKGFISTDNLVDDLSSNFVGPDLKEIRITKDINKEKVLKTPSGINNWVLIADKIEIVDDKWKSKKAIFTNDLLELKQVKIVVNSLEAIPKKDELRFKSSLSYLILDEKLQIPFWFGNRTLTKSGEGFSFKNRWNLGFDNVDKDGYFIGRKFNSIDLFNNFVLDLEPQFLIQRSIKGYTKSFVNEGDSTTGDKVRRDTSFKDYFALNSQIKGNINNWELKLDKELYSLDSEKFLDAFRVKANLKKEITFLNTQWDKNIYGIYRDRVWNGSKGEAEIYIGYGSKLEKRNTWEVNGVNKTEVISLGLGNLKGEALKNKDLVTSLKGNLFYSLDQQFPLFVDNPSNEFIDNSFNYINKPIKKGLTLNTNLELYYSLYESGYHQEYIGFGAGPEYIFGSFKKKYFDYTRINILPFYKIKSGDSIFKFDQIYDQFTLSIMFDQQLFGPLILKTTSTLNLDSNSTDYGDFINSKISLNWKKRSYEMGIFYQPHNESGGINFTLFGFK